MRVSQSRLSRIIQEELNRFLSEKVNPETFVQTSPTTFEVEAEPTKEKEFAAGWEPGETRTISGRLEQFKDRMLTKGDPANPPPGYSAEDMRGVSGSLSRQLSPLLADMFGTLPNISRSQRETKGIVVANALQRLKDKFPDDDDIQSVIDAIRGVKMGFEVPYSSGGEEEV